MGRIDRLAASSDVIARLAGQAPAPQYIRAYHGSPLPEHFDRFDASKIGTGEGAQAYSYGHYSAQLPEVASEYRRALSYRKLRDDFLTNLWEDADADEVMANLQVFDPRQQRFLRELHANDWLGFDYPSQAISQAAGRKSGFAGYEVTDSAREAGEQLGTGYELEIAVPESALLDWDASMIDQPPHVLEALQKLGMPSVDSVGSPKPGDPRWRFAGNELDAVYGFDTPWKIKGEHIYHAVKRHPAVVTGAEYGARARVTSEALRDVGVPGVRYLDGGSRHAGPSGTRNYVMFPGTEDLINILRKYSVPGAIGAGAAGGMQDQQ